MDWLDITLHTAPTVCVGALLGFFSAMGLHYIALREATFMAGALFCVTVYASWLWLPRERAQHGGELGGKQSKLEAIVPLIAGPLSFLIAIFVFFKIVI